ncbi:MAG: TerD family protein, partial [Frankiaceae bacterium]|nr:TerD family protein [Frankiaceae bacterium]
MTEIATGASLPIGPRGLRAALWWIGGPNVPDVDASALLLGPEGRVGSDDDFVFYNQPADPSGAVRYFGKAGARGQQASIIELDLDRVPGAVARIVLAASADGGTLGQVPGLVLQVADRASGAPVAVFRMPAVVEPALIGGEICRDGSEWTFRAVGRGYRTGLAGLAADFGIRVDGPSAEQPIAPPAPPAPAAPAPPPPIAPPVVSPAPVAP